MRETLAYRAMTTSFARLLSPKYYDQRLDSFAPNSASIHLPVGKQLDEFLKRVGHDSLIQERLYYMKRYLGEIGEGAEIVVAPSCLDPTGKRIVEERRRLFKQVHQQPYGLIDSNVIGKVSEKSRPYHERHVEHIRTLEGEILSCPVLNCDDHLLKYFRSKHPISEVRTWCNIMLGLRTFALSDVLSGHSAIQRSSESIGHDPNTSLSWHQRDLYMAIKLLFVAALRDNYAYGTNYCKALSMRTPQGGKRLDRVLRIYRLLSYLFPYMQYLLSHGHIAVSVVDAIQHELEEREAKKYKYQVKPEAPSIGLADTELIDQIIGGTQDKLFESLSNYAQSLVEVTGAPVGSTDLKEILSASELVFDIGIETRVNEMIERLNLVPTGPRGIIDLGDSDIMEAEDW